MPCGLHACRRRRTSACASALTVFALSLLGLKPLEELEEGLERQDHGTWLHAVLKRFHDDRPAELAPNDPAQDLVRWMAVALEVAREHGLMAAGQSAYFLPYQATLERLGAHYIQWLRQHEAQGWRVVDMEATRELELAFAGGRAQAQALRPIGSHRSADPV